MSPSSHAGTTIPRLQFEGEDVDILEEGQDSPRSERTAYTLPSYADRRPSETPTTVTSTLQAPPNALLDAGSGSESSRSRSSSFAASMLSGETANTDTPYEFMDLHRGPSDAELDEALKPDTEKDEAAFKVVNNNFAFTPGQLGKQLNPKSPNAFVAMGGLRGLELGLRTDRERGLNPDEKTLEGSVSLREARYAPFGDAAPDVPRPALKDVSSDHSSGSLPGAISKHPNTERRWRKKKIVHEAPRENFIDRYRVFSDNTLPQRKKKTFLQLMWQQYNDKVLILLTGAAIISLALGLYETLGTGDHIDEATGKKMPKVNWIEGVAICIAIILVVFTGSGNDYQKERQFKKLHSKKEDRNVNAIRGGKKLEINISDIMVGDVLLMQPGDKIPADGILIQGDDIKCDESSATGESDQMKKTGGEEAYRLLRLNPNNHKVDPFIISGAQVLSGTGTYLVTGTGKYSSYGKLMASLSNDPEETPLQVKLGRMADKIAYLGGGAAVILFIVLLIRFLAGLPNNPASGSEKGSQFLDILIVAITLVVVAVPEGLPLAVTLALAFATTRMMKENNLVRIFRACETMGNATTVCSDKTGTLTTNVMTVVAGTISTEAKFDKNDPLPEGDTGAALENTSSYIPPEDLPDSPDSAVVAQATLEVSHFRKFIARFTGKGTSTVTDTAITPVEKPKALIRNLNPGIRNLLFESIVMNTTAFEGVEASGHMGFIGSKTETALLYFARHNLGLKNLDAERGAANIKVMQVIPFDSARKCMGIVVRRPNGVCRLYVKGASEILLAKCDRRVVDVQGPLGTDMAVQNAAQTTEKSASDNDEKEQTFSHEDIPVTEVDITPEDRVSLEQQINSYAERSLRTIGLIYKDFKQWPPVGCAISETNRKHAVFEDVFDNMTLLGIVGIQDPLRPNVPEAVNQCKNAGVVVRMVTGDNIVTARAIAQECGIMEGPESIVMEGPVFRKLSPEKMDEVLPNLRVLARSSPEDKRILVERLKILGETVAVTGDGTNDGPALKTADVGFSMGIAGTEVAKEASSIILMDDNFASIVKAIMWGRAVNDSVRKFLQFQLTVNITAVLLTFVSAVASREMKSVLTAVQLLWVNLIMDTFAALALATDAPTPAILDRKPSRKDAPLISVNMWKMIIGQAIFQTIVTFVMHFARHELFPEWSEIERKTVVFNTFVWMQIFNEFNNRRLDNKFNIFEGMLRNYWFLGINAIMVGGQILIVFVGSTAFQIKSGGIDGTQWAICLVVALMSLPWAVVVRCVPDEVAVKIARPVIKASMPVIRGLKAAGGWIGSVWRALMRAVTGKKAVKNDSGDLEAAPSTEKGKQVGGL